MPTGTAKCPYCGKDGHVEGYSGEDCPDNPNTASGQAKAQLDSIIAMMDRLDHAKECNGDPCSLEPGDFCRALTELGVEDSESYHDEDAASQALDEDPLSVLVRSGWFEPGDPAMQREPVEYEILLCTGGPAVRVRGDLDNHGEPDNATLQYKAWGTPWDPFRLDREQGAALLAYARHFWYGE